MKKVVLSFLFLAATIIVFAQSVPRNMVIMEVGTGTWCQYCPGAAMGADDLLSHGKFVAVVENHNGDTYANAYSNSRNTFYGISGYPTATFDGNQAVVGGSHTNSMYSSYLPKYNAAIVIPSPVQMEMSETHSGLDYTVTIILSKVDVITASSLKLHFAVTQSNIQQNWQGQTHLEHVNRLMVPDQNGTVISFAGGDVQTVVLNFTLDAAWPLEDCEFIAWLQNYDAGQGNCPGGTVKKWSTFQGIKRGVIDLTPDFSVASNEVIINTPVQFTNATTGGYIGTPEEYEWIFPGADPPSSFDKDPIVSFPDSGMYDVTLIVNRGGQIDTLVKTAFIHASYAVGMQDGQTAIMTRVSPNPSKGLVTLDVFTGKSMTAGISVINALGMPVYQENGVAISGRYTKQIDLGSVAKGIYFVVVEQNGTKTVKKVVIN